MKPNMRAGESGGYCIYYYFLAALNLPA